MNICFHCQQTHNLGTKYHLDIDGKITTFCCAGCHAIAKTIFDAGLSAYYAQRTEIVSAPTEHLESLLATASTPSHANGDSTLHANIDGLVCGACSWLIERRLKQLPSVRNASVNLATHRLHVSWDANKQSAANLLAEVNALGYRTRPIDPMRRSKQHLADRSTLSRIAVAGLCAMQVMMFSYPFYLDNASDIDTSSAHMLTWAALIATLPVVCYSALPLFRRAFAACKIGVLTMDTPIALSIALAFIGSVIATYTHNGAIYYDSVTMFVFLLLVGRYFENRVRESTLDIETAITHLLPQTATRIDADIRTKVELEQIKPNDLIAVDAGKTIPCDGIIESGLTSINDAILSGESHPQHRSIGDSVVAGSINVESPIIVRVTASNASNRLHTIAEILLQAQQEKTPTLKRLDHIASSFLWALLALTVAAASYWYHVAPDRVLPITISILAIACPCALSLASPAAIAAAVIAMLKEGIIVKRSAAIEELNNITAVIFDKTGTLTSGKVSIGRIYTRNNFTTESAMQIAAALEDGQHHPYASAFANPKLELTAKNIQSHPGKGVQATIAETTYWLGAPSLQPTAIGLNDFPTQQRHSVRIYLGAETQVIAAFDLIDPLRADAAASIKALTASGLAISIISGDTKANVAPIAEALHSDAFSGGETPESKVTLLRNMQQNNQCVLMVGDGVNDAPVLAAANVSFALGSGTDLAKTGADCIITRNNLSALPRAIAIAKSTDNVIRQNIAWALAYNAIGIPLAVCDQVTPWVAAAGMSISSIIVILNSLRILRVKSSSLLAPSPQTGSHAPLALPEQST